jgi:hypothetical protein
MQSAVNAGNRLTESGFVVTGALKVYHKEVVKHLKDNFKLSQLLFPANCITMIGAPITWRPGVFVLSSAFDLN